MSRNALQFIVTILAAGLVAFGVTRWQARAAPGPSLDRMQDSDWLAETLDLTPEQVSAIQELKRDYRSALESCCERHCSARMEIGEDVFAADGSEEKQKEIAERLCRAQLDAELATIEHMRGVHRLLNPDQKKKYEELVQTCVCDSCPADVHDK
jgi:Spy/CpxP family protein refolding chaperone